MPLSAAASLVLRRAAAALAVAGALVTGATLAAEPQATPKAEQAPAAARSDKPAAKKMEFEKYVLV
ncbi:MAG TPA: hypothetical protein VK447_08620, partial [Myxococcaceae bacterium]|nr:hypothetical protein [Myxococcaceae bacterium]